MFISANTADSVVNIQLVFQSVLFSIIFFLAGQGGEQLTKRIRVSSWFVLPVGLSEWKITNV